MRLPIPDRRLRRKGVNITVDGDNTEFDGGPQFAMALAYADMKRALRDGGASTS